MDAGVGARICATLLGILLCGAALAQGPEMLPAGNASDELSGPVPSTIVFGSNLISDPCATCNYSDGGGYFVAGANEIFSAGRADDVA